jgi:long-chain acyl-CoA synthetase
MYSDTERRGYVRNELEIPIVYSDWHQENFHDAILRDLSKTGMSFLSDKALQPGSDISVKMTDSPPAAMNWLQSEHLYRAEVKWCRDNADIGIRGYKVGVNYFERFWEKSYDTGAYHLDPKVWETTYIDLIRPTFEEFYDKPALYYMGTSITFAELDMWSNRFANMLLENGFKKGDVVGINLPNIPEYVISWLGTLKAGCIVSGVSPLLSNEEMEYQLKDSGAKGLVTLDAIFSGRLIHIEKQLPNLEVVVAASVGGFVPVMKRTLGKLVGKIPRGKVTQIEEKTVYQFMEVINTDRFLPDAPDIKLTPDDICYIQYTGGTTGTPKGAMIDNRNIASDLLILNTWIDDAIKTGRSVSLSGFPFFHAAGLFYNIVCIYKGYAQVLIPNPRDTDHICSEIARYRPSLLSNVPSLYQMLIKNPKFKELDHSNLELCLSGASPFPVESQIELEGIVGKGKLLEVYGMTETSPLTTANPYQRQRKMGSIGLPLLNTDIKLVDPDTNKEVENGKPGELCVKGPQVMKGYYNKPEETRKSFTPDGFLRTGDVAIFDKEGYLTIVDRVKDMLLVGGFNVYSKKVEDTLAKHPAINMVAIIGLPNHERPGSELVKAFIVVEPDYYFGDNEARKKEDIIRFAKDKLAPYEVPQIIEIREELPLTAVGKIDKKQLRKQENE